MVGIQDGLTGLLVAAAALSPGHSNGLMVILADFKGIDADFDHGFFRAGRRRGCGGRSIGGFGRIGGDNEAVWKVEKQNQANCENSNDPLHNHPSRVLRHKSLYVVIPECLCRGSMDSPPTAAGNDDWESKKR